MEEVSKIAASVLPSLFWEIVAGIGAVAICLWFFFEKRFDKRVKDAQAADDRLIKTLQTTVDTLDSEVVKLKENDIKRGEEIAGLRAENDTLIKVLTGRDDRAKAFYDNFDQTAELIKATHQLTAQLAQNCDRAFSIIIDTKVKVKRKKKA